MSEIEVPDGVELSPETLGYVESLKGPIPVVYISKSCGAPQSDNFPTYIYKPYSAHVFIPALAYWLLNHVPWPGLCRRIYTWFCEHRFAVIEDRVIRMHMSEFGEPQSEEEK